MTLDRGPARIRTVVQKPNSGSETRPRRTRLRAEVRRQEILAAAARVFRRRGFADCGMREIAAEADLSPGNLYHYFSGKAELLYYCQDRSLDQMLAALQQARRSDTPAPSRLREVIRAHVLCLLDEFEGSAAHLEVEALPDELRRAIITKRDRYERGIRKLVSDGVRRAELCDCDPRLVTRAMLGAMNWTARWFRPEGSQSADTVADSLADYLVQGLLGDARSAPQPERGAATAAGPTNRS